MSLYLARGSDFSSAWQKQPLGTRLILVLINIGMEFFDSKLRRFSQESEVRSSPNRQVCYLFFLASKCEPIDHFLVGFCLRVRQNESSHETIHWWKYVSQIKLLLIWKFCMRIHFEPEVQGDSEIWPISNNVSSISPISELLCHGIFLSHFRCLASIISLEWPSYKHYSSHHSRPRSHDPYDLRQWPRALALPTPEVHDSRTSRQIWPIWLAENMKRILCTCSENRVRPEFSIPAAGQKDRGSGDENEFPWKPATRISTLEYQVNLINANILPNTKSFTMSPKSPDFQFVINFPYRRYTLTEVPKD